VLAIALIAHTRVHAASTEIQVEVQPNTIQLAAGESTRVLVIVRNGSTDPLQDLQLEWYGDAGIIAEGPKLEDSQLRQGGALAWSVAITQTAGGRTGGTLYFQVNYTRTLTDSRQGTSDVVIAPLQIQERAVEAVGQIVAAKIEAALEQIQEPRTGILFLVVQNLATVPITVTNITSYHPNFINLQMPDVRFGQRLAPQTSRTFPITVTVNNSVQTGKQLLLFEVGAEWIKAGLAGSGSVSVTHPLEVGILGESDLLKLVGIPSFLFLPGFFALTAFLFFWSRYRPESAKEAKLEAPEYAFLSVVISIFAAAIYPPLMLIVWQERRNYLEAYGVLDIFFVSGLSVAAGIAVWILLVGGWATFRKLRELLDGLQAAQQQKEIEKRTPRKNDFPLDIVKKMILNGVSFPLSIADVTHADGQQDNLFVIFPKTDDPSQSWVSTSIKATPKNELTQKERKDWQDRLEKATLSSPAELATEIAKATESGWTFDWNQNAANPGPTPVPSNQLGNLDVAKRYFVEIG
jgi:hypothetical protein